MKGDFRREYFDQFTSKVPGAFIDDACLAAYAVHEVPGVGTFLVRRPPPPLNFGPIVPLLPPAPTLDSAAIELRWHARPAFNHAPRMPVLISHHDDYTPRRRALKARRRGSAAHRRQLRREARRA